MARPTTRLRRIHTPKFKAEVALAALSSTLSLAQIAEQYTVHPNLVSQWRKQLSTQAAAAFNSQRAPASTARKQLRQAQLDTHSATQLHTRPPKPALRAQQETLMNLAFGESHILFDSLNDIQYWIKDTECRYIHVNTCFLENYSLDSINHALGKTDYDLSPAHLAERFHSDDQLLLQTGQSISHQLELVGNSSGSVHWFNTSKCVMKNKRGNIIGTSGISYPLSDKQVALSLYGDMGAVIAHIKENIHKNISIAELADCMSLSVSAFERRFKRFFQLSPSQYIKRIRVRMACEMLVNTDQPITDIAIECGFCDHSYLSKEFKRILNQSPKDYRRHFTQLPQQERNHA